MSLLSFPILLERFNINEIEFKILKQWIQKANIKLGINKQHLYELFNIKTNYNNWNFGINNMLLSYSVNENNFIWNNNVSYNEFHHEHAELIAKIQEFIILLNKWKKIFLYSNNLIIWKTKFKKMIKDFFSTKYLHHEFILFLQDTWNKIINDGIKSKFKKKINIKILKNIFLKQVQKRNYHSNLCIGSINFCNIDTLENISFKMIYLLGINENIYPRKTNEKFFNLITHKLKIGDINYRMYDFHMFYNCLFNAKQYFYISYINNHSSDSNTINSSIVIEILQKYIINNFKIMTHDINLIQSETTIENQKKIINHLYHFHPITIYNKNNKLFCCKNYKKLDHDVIIEKKYNQINNINNNSCNNIYTTINVQDLIKFWKHPIRFFFNHTLKVKIPYLQKNESELNYFYINPIHIYQMKSEILDSLIYKKNINYLHILYSQSGILPYGNFGKHIWEQMIIEMHDLYKKIYLLRDKPNRKKICITINSYQLQNYQLSEIHKIGLIRWKPNIIYIPDIISLWIEHLIYCYLQGNGMSYVLGTKNSCSFSTVSVQTAKKYLNMYITGYIKGISQPLLLTKSGITWLLSQYNNNNNIIFNNNLDYQKSNKQFFNIWNGNTINDGEKQDFYINKIIPNLDQSIFLKLCNTAKKWFLPILHYYKKNNLQ
ncbi:hypothetical protein [Buchnera aphidicola]|uniref:hypothetical protein n=1 Tax=Buchnera aphidicola TaxID=9 RepID=UPI003464341C